MPGLLSRHRPTGLSTLSRFSSPTQGQLSLAEAMSNYPEREPARIGLAQLLVPQGEQGSLNIGGKVSWLGHGFYVYQRGADWYEVAGVYILSGRSPDDQGMFVWHPFYVGQCQSFAGYIPTHRKWLAAERLGATHVHARVEQGVLARQNLEAELIQAYQPPLNVQLR